MMINLRLSTLIKNIFLVLKKMDSYLMNANFQQQLGKNYLNARVKQNRNFLNGLVENLSFLKGRNISQRSVVALKAFLNENSNLYAYKSNVMCYIAKNIANNLVRLKGSIEFPKRLAIFSADEHGNLSGFIGEDNVRFTDQYFELNGESMLLQDVYNFPPFEDTGLQEVVNYLASMRRHELTIADITFYYDNELGAFYFN